MQHSKKLVLVLVLLKWFVKDWIIAKLVFQRKMTSAIHFNIVKINWPYDNPGFVLKIGQPIIWIVSCPMWDNKDRRLESQPERSSGPISGLLQQEANCPMAAPRKNL